VRCSPKKLLSDKFTHRIAELKTNRGVISFNLYE
jgi:hypothetical protein